MVDDAIVVLENIVRHMEMGKSRMEAALEGGREIAFTILSMTLSLAAVFIPVLFMGGIVGRLFHEFAVVIMVAILISGFVSLSLTPMLCSRFLKPPTREAQRAVSRLRARLRRHARSVRLDAARRDPASLRDADGRGRDGGRDRVLSTDWLPKGFIPNQDTDQIGGVTEMPQDASFDVMVRLQQQVAAVIGADPNVDAYFSLRQRAGRQQGVGQFRPLAVAPEAARGAQADAGTDHRRAAAQAERDSGRPDVPAESAADPHRRAADAAACISTRCRRRIWMSCIAPRAISRSACSEIPGLFDVNSDLQIASPDVMVDIDRDRASALGVTADQIENALYDAFGTRQVSDIYTPTNDY